MDRLTIRKDRWISYALFLVVFSVGIFVAPRIGPAWDEPDNMYSAGVYAQFITRGFDTTLFDTQEARRSLWDDRIYPLDRFLAHLPPVHNYVGVLFVWIRTLLGVPQTAANIITAFHWSAAVFLGILVVSVFHVGRLLGLSSPAAAAAGLMTWLYPTLFGHGYSNTKDIAQAALFTLSLYYLLRCEVYRGNRGRNMVIGSFAWGLALATKFNAVYVPVIWSLWAFLRGPASRLPPRIPARGPLLGGPPTRVTPLRLFSTLSIFVSLGIATTIAVWPYLWFDPVDRITEVVRYFTTVGQGYGAYWDGIRYQVGAGRVLWWYPWANFFLVTPIPLLILGVIGGIGVIRERRERGKWRDILLIWIIVPTIRAFFPNAAFYDGLRHFLEILPAWILLAAIGIETSGILGKYGKSVITVIVLGQLLYINATYNPYSTGYYNFFAKNPNVRFDRDIEALSVKEGIEYLHQTYGAIRLWSPIGGHLSWYYLTGSDRYVYNASDADSIILVNKSSHILQAEFDKTIRKTYTLVHVIQRADAIFAWIYRRI